MEEEYKNPYENNPINNANNWLYDWYKNRPSKLIKPLYYNAFSILNPVNIAKYLFKNDEDLSSDIKREIYNRIVNTPEYDFTGRNYNGFNLSKIDDQYLPYEYKTNRDYVNLSLDGWYDPIFQHIIYTDSADESTPIHEKLHSLYDKFSNIGDQIGTPYKNLLKGVDRDEYLDNKQEVNSRLGEFRYRNHLDPKRADYTLEEIKTLRNNSSDTHLFDRYTDEYMQHLLNNVASTNKSYKGSIESVKFGNKLFHNKYELRKSKNNRNRG